MIYTDGRQAKIFREEVYTFFSSDLPRSLDLRSDSLEVSFLSQYPCPFPWTIDIDNVCRACAFVYEELSLASCVKVNIAMPYIRQDLRELHLFSLGFLWARVSCKEH